MPVAAIPGGLAVFQELLKGRWTNQPFTSGGPGGQDQPFSFNVMPLPQAGGNDGAGYILKNFSLYEIVKFDDERDVALPATAPNRGSSDLQVPTALFYEQQVYFAEGPGSDPPGIVHVENGAWLNLETGDKLVGPYPPPPGTGIHLQKPNQQPANITIAKQMSVPHGNSILALGSFDSPASGTLAIPDSASTLPTPKGLDTKPYTTVIAESPDNYQNPSVELTQNPNLALQKGVAALKPNSWIHWAVSTGNQGQTMNIPFEKRAANVTAYSADYWLLSTDGGKQYDHLAYSQNITLVLLIGTAHYTFPHVTTNIVTKEK